MKCSETTKICCQIESRVKECQSLWCRELGVRSQQFLRWAPGNVNPVTIEECPFCQVSLESILKYEIHEHYAISIASVDESTWFLIFRIAEKQSIGGSEFCVELVRGPGFEENELAVLALIQS